VLAQKTDRVSRLVCGLLITYDVIRHWPVHECCISNCEKSIPHRQSATPHHNTLSDAAIAMATPGRCLATATKNLKNRSIATIPQRTITSSTRNSFATSRNATALNTTCLKELQRAQIGVEKSANSLRGQIRAFSQSASRNKLKTIDQIRARNKGGVCSIRFEEHLSDDMGVPWLAS
jgi:hypothetical protein